MRCIDAIVGSSSHVEVESSSEYIQRPLDAVQDLVLLCVRLGKGCVLQVEIRLVGVRPVMEFHGRYVRAQWNVLWEVGIQSVHLQHGC